MIVIYHQNTDAMVLADALLGGIHPPDNIQNDRRPGGNASSARTGWDVTAVTDSKSTFCVFLFSARGVTASVYGTCRVTNHDK
jgi:hypothetical protein